MSSWRHSRTATASKFIITYKRNVHKPWNTTSFWTTLIGLFFIRPFLQLFSYFCWKVPRTKGVLPVTRKPEWDIFSFHNQTIEKRSDEHNRKWLMKTKNLLFCLSNNYLFSCCLLLFNKWSPWSSILRNKDIRSVYRTKYPRTGKNGGKKFESSLIQGKKTKPMSYVHLR